MDKNTFFQYKETQAQVGYRSALLYKKPGETKYRFLCPSETVPFFGESRETFDFNLLNSPSIGKVEGKENTEAKEVELLYTRNNAILFEQLKDQVLDFMSLTPQMVGYKATGKISFRANDATAEIHRGTYTITPMDVDPTPYFMAREEVLAPLFFASAIPDEISISELSSTSETISIDVSVKGGEGATYKYDKIDATTNKVSGIASEVEATNGLIQIPKEAGLYVIYAEPATANVTTHSGCFTTIYITD